MMRREDILRVLDLTSKWATAEIIRGLLQEDRLLKALEGGLTAETWSSMTGLSLRQVRSLAMSLEIEDIIEEREGAFRLTSFGSSLNDSRGWMQIFMDGYGGYFREAEALLGGTVRPEWRVMRHVGVNSARITRWDALPMITRLIQEHVPTAAVVMEFGCGNAYTLVMLCQEMETLAGIGVEPDPALCEEAQALVAQSGLANRIRIVGAPTQDYMDDARPDVVIFAFVLHELVEQIGRAALVALLRRLRISFRGAWFIAVEVDVSARSNSQHMRTDPYLRGYYNYYYLLHDFTTQRLLTTSEWRELLAEAGFAVKRQITTPLWVDDTGMEVALLFREADD